jgi:hypothetical protein
MGLDIDEAVAQSDIDTLRSVAGQLNELLNKKYLELQSMGAENMV